MEGVLTQRSSPCVQKTHGALGYAASFSLFEMSTFFKDHVNSRDVKKQQVENIVGNAF